MPLGREVGFGSGDIVFDGTQSPKSTAPNFRPMSNVANGLVHKYPTWYGGRPRPRRHCVRWGPSSRPKKGHGPQFSAHVYCGQTVAHLSYCWVLVATVTQKRSEFTWFLFCRWGLAFPQAPPPVNPTRRPQPCFWICSCVPRIPARFTLSRHSEIPWHFPNNSRVHGTPVPIMR